MYYGASELNYITYIRGSEMKEDTTLVGRAFPEVDVWIENDHFHQVVSDRAQSRPCRNGVLLISGYPCHKTDTVHLHKGPTDRYLV